MELEMSIIAQLYISVSRSQRLRSIKEHSELLLFYTGELSQFYNSLSADSSPDIFVSCCLVFFALTFCLSVFGHNHKVQYRCDHCIVLDYPWIQAPVFNTWIHEETLLTWAPGIYSVNVHVLDLRPTAKVTSVRYLYVLHVNS